LAVTLNPNYESYEQFSPEHINVMNKSLYYGVFINSKCLIYGNPSYPTIICYLSEKLCAK